MTSLDDILQEFRFFYSSLYTSLLPPNYDPVAMYPLLDMVALGWLSDSEFLVGPITSEKVGWPPNWNLQSTLCRVGSSVSYLVHRLSGERHTPLLHKRDSHIVLIHKSPKDLALCASYRPIALLNLDIKILTKLLTNRLNSILPTVIDSDQMGFISGESTDINIHRLFTNIHAPHSNPGTWVIAFLDTEKGLDTVEWEYLWEVMRRMGFPPVFIQ